MINVCMITDNNYCLPTMTAIQSIISNSNNDNVKINVLANNVDEIIQKQIQCLQTECVKINIVQVNDYEENIEEHRYVSKSALLKFKIPYIFENLDKILYLDTDIIVQKSLSHFYNIELGDRYVAVVEDMVVVKEQKERNVEIVHSHYFNSGIMLMNLKLLREEKIPEKLMEDKKTHKSRYMDQDSLNRVLAGNAIWLEPIYNLLISNFRYSFDDIADFYNLPSKEVNSIVKNAVIIHLAGAVKVWDSIDAEGFKYWYPYFKILPESDLKSKKKKYIRKQYVDKVFSIKRQEQHIVMTILGIKIKVKRKSKNK